MERLIPLENHAGLAADTLAALAHEVGRHHSVKQVVDWLANRDTPRGLAGMVTHDEFSHDLLVAGPGALWLVYDST